MDGSVASADVTDGTLVKADVATDALLGGHITTQGVTAAVPLADGDKASYGVFCPAGQVGIAGGGRGDDTNSELTYLTSSRPSVSSGNTEPPTNGGTFSGWRITVLNPPGGAAAVINPTVWVVCAS